MATPSVRVLPTLVIIEALKTKNWLLAVACVLELPGGPVHQFVADMFSCVLAGQDLALRLGFAMALVVTTQTHLVLVCLANAELKRYTVLLKMCR